MLYDIAQVKKCSFSVSGQVEEIFLSQIKIFYIDILLTYDQFWNHCFASSLYNKKKYKVLETLVWNNNAISLNNQNGSSTLSANYMPAIIQCNLCKG